MANINFTDTISTTAKHGHLALASQIFDEQQGRMQSDINEGASCHKELGSFERSGLAEAAAALPPICSDPSIAVIHYRISTNNRSGIILQQVDTQRTTQIIILDGLLYTRYINFSSSSRTEVSSVGSWQVSFVNYMTYDTSSHLLKLWWNGIAGITDVTLPLASSSSDGLLSSADYKKIFSTDDATSLLSRIKALEEKLSLTSSE